MCKQPIIEHFQNLETLYQNASVQMPNDLFSRLADSIKNSRDRQNTKQASFAYTYLVAIAFLYKYTHFVDPASGTYIQNLNLKELLGYNKGTKSIDRIIKKGGVLDEMELTRTTRNFPVYFRIDVDDRESEYPKRDFALIDELTPEDFVCQRIKQTVKNHNYEIKEPLFLIGHLDAEGTLYDFRRTHKVTIQEFIAFISDDSLSNLDFLTYCYLKSKCHGHQRHSKSITLQRIMDEAGIDAKSFYRHLNVLKERQYITVTHGKWRHRNLSDTANMVANIYHWKGVS